MLIQYIRFRIENISAHISTNDKSGYIQKNDALTESLNMLRFYHLQGYSIENFRKGFVENLL